MTSDDSGAEELKTPQEMMQDAARLGRQGKGAEADAMYRQAAAGFEAEGKLLRAAQALTFARAKDEANAMHRRAASQPS